MYSLLLLACVGLNPHTDDIVIDVARIEVNEWFTISDGDEKWSVSMKQVIIWELKHVKTPEGEYTGEYNYIPTKYDVFWPNNGKSSGIIDVTKKGKYYYYRSKMPTGSGQIVVFRSPVFIFTQTPFDKELAYRREGNSFIIRTQKSEIFQLKLPEFNHDIP